MKNRRRVPTRCGRALRGISFFSSLQAAAHSFSRFCRTGTVHLPCVPAQTSACSAALPSVSSKQVFLFGLKPIRSTHISTHLDLLLAGCVYTCIVRTGSDVQQLNQLFLNDEMLHCRPKNNSFSHSEAAP